MATYKTYTKQHIEAALLDLLAEKPLSSISISELTERAQVNRASFYRNFDSKEDVLLNCFSSRFNAWAGENEAMTSTEGDPYEQTRGFFEFMLAERRLVMALHHSGNLDIMLRHLSETIGPVADDHPDEAFYRAFYLHGMFGVYREWISQGMRQSPERMAALVVYGMHETHDSLLRAKK